MDVTVTTEPLPTHVAAADAEKLLTAGLGFTVTASEAALLMPQELFAVTVILPF